MSSTKQQHRVTAIVVSAMVLSITTSIVFYQISRHRRQQQQQQQQDEQGTRTPIDELSCRKEYQLLPKPLRQELEDAIRNIRLIGFKMKLSNQDKCILYGLYKQIIEGDAPRTLPKLESWNILKESMKYNAWCQYRGRSCHDATIHYIAFVRHLESLSDWEKLDHDDDNDDEDEDGVIGSVAVSRPIDSIIPFDVNDHYDDIVDGTTSIGSQLLKAASENDVMTTRTILQNDPNLINHTDPTGQTALHIAADKGCLDVIQSLIEEYNADVDVMDEDGISVLQTAVVANHFQICQWLLQNTNANPDQPDHDGDTPRTCAQDSDPIIYQYFQSIPIRE
jgi:acyl-CoA-binding protein